MRISQSTLDRYRESLLVDQSRASAFVSNTLRRLYEENPDATTEQARDCVIEAIQDALSIYGEHSAAVACDLFDEICEAEGIPVTSRIYDTVNMKLVEEKIRWAAKFHAAGFPEQFEARSQDLAAYYVRRNALENVIKNCDENDVRYARVPTGFETCGFCFMLAGRGFVYHSEASAIGSHGFHSHCDCIVIPGKKGRTKIDGYDQEELGRRFSEVRNSVRYQARKEWDALSPEEKEAEGSWNEYLRRATCREIEHRNTRWAWSGKGSGPDRSRLSNRNWKRKDKRERAGYLSLAEDYGYRVTVLPEDSDVANIDMLLGDDLWELKTVYGTGASLNNRIEDGVSKWRRLHASGDLPPEDTPRIVVDNRFSTAADEDIRAAIRKNQDHFSSDHFDRAILLTSDGQIEYIDKK